MDTTCEHRHAVGIVGVDLWASPPAGLSARPKTSVSFEDARESRSRQIHRPAHRRSVTACTKPLD